jgi:hypothetical protein
MAKRMSRGPSSESSACSRHSRGRQVRYCAVAALPACGSGQGQEQTHSFLYPARDDGDDDHQQGFLQRRGSPNADGRACSRLHHRPHGVCRLVGLPGPVSEPCPRFRIPIARADEVPRRPVGRELARRCARWPRCPISRPRPPAHGDRQPATRAATHDRGPADIIRPGSRASTTSLEPQASDRTDPLVRSRTHYACRRNKLAIQQSRRR